MAYALFVAAAALVAFGVAVVATGRIDGLDAAAEDVAHPVLPEGPVGAADVHDLRFALGLRGYRMDQVDAVLDRLATEIAARDEELARLHERADSGPEEDT